MQFISKVISLSSEIMQKIVDNLTFDLARPKIILNKIALILFCTLIN